MSKETISWNRSDSVARLTSFDGGSRHTCARVSHCGGDAEEIERFHLVSAVGSFLAENRIKVYSVDSLAGSSWFTESNDSAEASKVQNQFDSAIYHEVMPAIRKDCGVDSVEIITAGASLGAFTPWRSCCVIPTCANWRSA